MCKIPTPTKPARFCRWLTLDAARLMRSGVGATLSITDRGRTAVYYVTPVDGGYELMRTHEDNEGYTVYRVDTSFGGGPEHWDCTCPQFVYRHRRVGRCKHCLALAAALRKLGLLEAK